MWRLLQERAQLDCQLCDTSVIVQMDNSRDLDMEGIIKSVECCYEEIAQKSKAEVEAFYQTRVSTGSARTGTNETSWPTEPQGPFLSSVMQLTTHAAVRRRCRLLEKVMPKKPKQPKNHLKLCLSIFSKTKLTALVQRGLLCAHQNTVPFPKGRCSGPTWVWRLVWAEVTSGCVPGAPVSPWPLEGTIRAR